MKRSIRWLVFLLLALLSVISATVYAHPGRTDGSGGHTNHSTGEYHYHHGYSEHRHYDMDGDGIVDCPYEFKDNTAHKDSGSSNNSSFTDKYNDLRQQQSEGENDKDVTTDKSGNSTVQNTAKNSKPTAKEIIGTIFAVIFFGPLMLYVPICIISFIFGEVRDLIQKLKKK